MQPLFLQLGLREDAAISMDAIPTAPMAPSPSPPASAAAGQEPVVTPSQQVRSGSPGSAGGSGGRAAANGRASNPICQVDDCRVDLTGANAYFRRHRVCQTHSRASRALLASQMQRFCQMCSRFHRLAEFDENKRSCRRRLAGFITRRRRGQPAGLLARLPGNHLAG